MMNLFICVKIILNINIHSNINFLLFLERRFSKTHSSYDKTNDELKEVESYKFPTYALIDKL